MHPENKKYVIIFYIALILFIALQILTLYHNNPLWWDEAVYIGMGKYIFSGCSIGFWEEIRPPIMPLFSGILWKLGFDPLSAGRTMAMLFSAGTIVLTYLIGRRAFGEKEGITAAVLLAFTKIYFYFSTLLLSDIISLFFAMAAIYAYISIKSEKSMFITGIFVSMAFLTRFPMAAVAAAIAVSIIISEKYGKKGAFSFESTLNKIYDFMSGVLFLVIPYLLINEYLYGSFAKPFISANKNITKIYSWLYDLGYGFYFNELWIQSTFLAFTAIGIIYFVAGKLWQDKEKLPVFVAGLFLIIYFTLLNHKEARYMLAFLPYLFIIAAYGFFEILRMFEKAPYKQIASVISIIFLSITVWNLVLVDIERAKEVGNISEFEKTYSKMDFGKGPLFSSTRNIVVYSDLKITPIYYSLIFTQNNYDAIHDETGYAIFNSCDFPCPEEDIECSNTIKAFARDIQKNSKTIYYGNDSKCDYYIFQKQKVV
ncbi:MAG: glycosyltransferase family 39 protein [Nanoarchaeota archaeon]|nr:glycosyltransferase family 39 protein [Nanoarchaeota archaeon]MBU4451784.1 glycosyltransferase family 39 protein [Nanoarchaeota archaeon]MCG2723487.1 glycosyltransferase family 39 protein [archaeon]